MREIIAEAKLAMMKGPRSPIERIKRAFQLVRDKAKDSAKKRRGRQGVIETAVNAMSEDESQLLLKLAEGKHHNEVNW